jgi:hypothetical protein
MEGAGSGGFTGAAEAPSGNQRSRRKTRVNLNADIPVFLFKFMARLLSQKGMRLEIFSQPEADFFSHIRDDFI